MDLQVYTTQQLLRKWSDHDLTEQDIYSFCEQGLLNLSVYVRSCDVVALRRMDRNGQREWFGLGRSRISGVFDTFNDIDSRQLLGRNEVKLKYLVVCGPHQSDGWSSTPPQEIHPDKAYSKWMPLTTELQQKAGEVVELYWTVPIESVFVPHLGKIVETSNLFPADFESLKREIDPDNPEVGFDYKWPTTFTREDIRFRAAEVSRFESKYLTISDKQSEQQESETGEDAPDNLVDSSKQSQQVEPKYKFIEPADRNDTFSRMLCVVGNAMIKSNGVPPTPKQLWGEMCSQQDKRFKITPDVDENNKVIGRYLDNGEIRSISYPAFVERRRKYLKQTDS